MTLKNKLARLQGLQQREQSLRTEIKELQDKYSTTYKKYDMNDLKKKYLQMDFSSITPKDLRDIMIEDFENSNMTLIEKHDMYKHNMNMLASILDKTKKHDVNFNSLDDTKQALGMNLQNETKRIDIKNGLDDFIKQYDTDDSDFEDNIDEEVLEKLNALIDKEYEFNLKILKSYAIFCHYRDILLPSKEDLAEMKDDIEGWKFIPKEDIRQLKQFTEVIFFTLINGSMIMMEGHFNRIIDKQVEVILNYIPFQKLKKKNMKREYKLLNKFNPIFRKISIDDVDN